MQAVRGYRSKRPRLVKKPKILLIGQIGAGKSSFISSVDKVFNGAGAQPAHVEDDGGQSITRVVRLYDLQLVLYDLHK